MVHCDAQVARLPLRYRLVAHTLGYAPDPSPAHAQGHPFHHVFVPPARREDSWVLLRGSREGWAIALELRRIHRSFFGLLFFGLLPPSSIPASFGKVSWACEAGRAEHFALNTHARTPPGVPRAYQGSTPGGYS